MASPLISKTSCLCLLIYLTATLCSASQETGRQHERYHHLQKRTSYDYYEEEDREYISSSDLSDMMNEEASGDYNAQTSGEKIENPGFKKIKFSNELEPDDNDITIMPEIESSSREPPINSNIVTMTPEINYSTSEPTVKTTVTTTTTTKQTQTVASSTPSPGVATRTMPATSTTSIQTTIAMEATTSTSDDDVCRTNDCEETEVEVIPKHQSLLPGGNFSLLCKMTANVSQPLQFKWWYLEDHNGLFQINDATGNELVQEAKLSNGGKYICVASDERGCCASNATSVVVIYEKPAYWIHIAVLLGISLGLLLFICVPFTLKMQRKYRYTEAFKKHDAQDKQPLTV